MEEKVLETIKKYNLIESGDKIVLGVSGGPDSISMLLALYNLKDKLNYSIVVAHVNHSLRENAKRDEEYVKKICKGFNVKCFCKTFNVKEIAKIKKLTLEEAGRKVRYEFFNEVLKEVNANKIALAHNKSDVAETVLMNIIRGCGINGLRGIEAKCGIYIRPLIELSREEIEEYSKKYNPCHDETNDESIYTRNKIRNKVLPYINAELNSGIIENLNNLSNHAKEADDFIKNEARKQYEKCKVSENLLKENNKTVILDLKIFNTLDVLIEKEILLIGIKKVRGTIEGIGKVHLEDLIKLCKKNVGNKYLIPKKYLKIEIKNKNIYINYEK